VNENLAVKIRQLLGDVVLIPIYRLTKNPVEKNWQRRTRESMQDPIYLRSFAGKNIGVLLGKASGGLCTIDFDLDADIEPFLENNSRLRDTTRTKRVRGCNFWIFIDGYFPASTTLTPGGKKLGEWRADGNQTVIYGRAIDKRKGETEPTEYKFLNEVPPIHIRFDEIIFPEGCFEKSPPRPPTIRLNTESCIATSLHDCIPASLHNKAVSVLANIKVKREALDSLTAKHPNLVRLYTELIEPRYQAQAHARNDFIVQAVPFLYRAVAARFVLELVGCFYDCNRALFNDPREQHMKEAKAMLESVVKTYTETLNADERGIYDALPGNEQETFRICRDLALLETPDMERGTFYMSFNQLGDRLGIFPPQAQRIMRQFESYGLIKLLKKGTRRAAGVPSLAGTYQWLLQPQPERPAK
jgi:hypothetical protein